VYVYKVKVVHEQLLQDISILQYYVTPHAKEMDDWFWTDEAWFHLDGNVSSHNSAIWLAGSPHELHETSLYSQTVGVWCAI